MSKGRKVVFGVMALFILVTTGKSVVASAMGALIRLDVLMPAMLVFFLPIPREKIEVMLEENKSVQKIAQES